ncbi:ester cyclase [Saccharopolyspora sp. NPDC050389]|uniref:ester cyclase n=1 Tax=Saccharopolyspora sp. NPDC050389 TaxID=3155516 RepID=UPI0033E525BD
MSSNPGKADLGAIFDEHLADEFVMKDVSATMTTMTKKPVVNHVPTTAGGAGRAAVSRFYRDHFIGQWPDDIDITRLSRTADAERVVDEMVITFTHDRVIDALLPGVAPTGRRVEIAAVAVIGCENGKVAYEHIYWDQASLLVQVGLLARDGLPVTGAEQVKTLLNDGPLNVLQPAKAKSR